MAHDWVRLPSYSSREEAESYVPHGWRVFQIEDLYEQLSVGKRFEQKTSFPSGVIPIIDQSESGVIGYHNEEPGVIASPENPVVTFANHTCEMRLMTDPFSVIQNVFPLIGKNGVCRTKFFYYLTKGRVWLEEYKGHFPDFRRKWVCCPPESEQERLENVFCAFDAKIDLNRRISQTLEAMAQAIFKSWFVDFDPVKAKIAAIEQGQDPLRAAMRAISGKTDAELDQMPREHHDQLAATAALFPDAMEESELGEIPKGWEVVPASALIEFNPKEPLRKGAVAPYLDMASLPTSGSWAEPPVPREFGSGMRFRNGDALLARITPCLENGKSAFIQNLPDESVGWGSTEFIVMRSKKPVPQEYAYLLVRHAAFREHAIRSMTGTSGRQRAQADAVAEFKVVTPASPLIWSAFEKFLASFFRQIKSQSEEIETLSQLRDTLLPKLLSGELSVSSLKDRATA